MKLDFNTIRPLTSRGNYEITVFLSSLKDTIQRYMDRDNLTLDVDFQRGHVWNEQQQVKFVEFVLRGGASPAILLNHPNWMGSFRGDMVIVDGKQRLTALLKFLDNELEVFDGHKLNDIENLHLSSCSILVNVNNLKTRKEVLRWYIELNEGQTPHTDEELNKVKELLNKSK